jgi:general secretion pathway protein E/type IV pilus assembly protein PilB
MIVFAEKPADVLKLNAVQMRIARAALADGDRLQQATLNQLGARNEEIALVAIAAKLGVPVVDVAKSEIPSDALENFPIKLVHRRNVFPLGRQADGSLLVATSNPFDLSPIDEISAAK